MKKPNKDEALKLLGGYATGSLTDAEQKALFEAALNDQELFEALAAEQEIKEAIEMPGARERLIRALEPAAPSRAWWKQPWWKQAWTWAAASTAAVAALALVFMINSGQQKPQELAQAVRPAAEPTRAPLQSARPAEVPETNAPAPARANEADSRKVEPGRDRAQPKPFTPPPQGSASAIREEKAIEPPPAIAQSKPVVPGSPDAAGRGGTVSMAKLPAEREAQQLKDSATSGFRPQSAQTPLGSARQDASELRRSQAAQETMAGTAAFARMRAGPVSIKWQLSGNELAVEPRVPAFLYIVSRSATRSELLRSQSNILTPLKVTVPPGAEEILIVLSGARIEVPVDVKTETFQGTDGSLEGPSPLIVRIPLPKRE